MRRSWYPAKFTAPMLILLAAILLTATGCVQKAAPPPPVPKFPSEVITEDGLKYFVRGLKLPGTSQQLKFRTGDALTWMPLSIIQVFVFTGPEYNRYRPAQIFLNSGERLSGELFVDQLIEGTTDLGYWNIPLRRVNRVEMGTE